MVHSHFRKGGNQSESGNVELFVIVRDVNNLTECILRI